MNPSVPMRDALADKSKVFSLATKKLLRRTRNSIQYVEHTEGDGAKCLKRFVTSGLKE